MVAGEPIGVQGGALNLKLTLLRSQISREIVAPVSVVFFTTVNTANVSAHSVVHCSMLDINNLNSNRNPVSNSYSNSDSNGNRNRSNSNSSTSQ